MFPSICCFCKEGKSACSDTRKFFSMGTARCKCRNNNGQKLSYLKISSMRVTCIAQPRSSSGWMERVDPEDVLGVGSAGAPAWLRCSFCFHQNMFCFYGELSAPLASLCTAAAQATGRGAESQPVQPEPSNTRISPTPSPQRRCVSSWGAARPAARAAALHSSQESRARGGGGRG